MDFRLCATDGGHIHRCRKPNLRIWLGPWGQFGVALGAKFVQEVNSVTMAVEMLHPDVGSVVELGGQDAKIIIFKPNEKTGEKTAITSMNDKCASGTGATIDKCVLKVGMPREEIPELKFDASALHHVAAKCGVFAETDIVNLVKSGVPRSEIMNSLADAIVRTPDLYGVVGPSIRTGEVIPNSTVDPGLAALGRWTGRSCAR